MCECNNCGHMDDGFDLEDLANDVKEMGYLDSDDRLVGNMMDYKGKHCHNCHWGGDDGGNFITCGYHHENFFRDSMCAYWTSLNDEMVLSERLKRYEEIRKNHLRQV